jgi:uncharacterized protein (TIGR02594 family)
MTQFNHAVLEAAGAYLGLQEWPGAKQNPKIVSMFATVGHGQVQDDETPWCAAFVGSVLASLGLPHTGKLNARSYQTYGQGVRTQDARPGDIVVLWRGSPTSWQGHVAFFVRFEGDKVILRGGNQTNGKVTDDDYPIDRILAVRRADGVEPQGKRPVLRAGDRGAFVHDLQSQLATLGYTLGKQDGIMGARTVAAVVAFQTDNNLVADGVVGDRTWQALHAAPPRALRDVTRDDLKDSRTIRTAGEGKNIAAVTASVGAVGAAVSAGEQAYDVAQRAGGLMQAILAAGPWVVALLVVGIGGWLIWQRFQRIEALRIEDARTGANDAR